VIDAQAVIGPFLIALVVFVAKGFDQRTGAQKARAKCWSSLLFVILLNGISPKIVHRP